MIVFASVIFYLIPAKAGIVFVQYKYLIDKFTVAEFNTDKKKCIFIQFILF